MKIYLKTDVLSEAKKRINRLFDEFPNVMVGFSGGKDSSVIYELTLEVARERNRLPLDVVWIDQEAEFTQTLEVIEDIMHNPDVRPIWLQIPFKITSAVSNDNLYFHCWEEGVERIRPKDPMSIKENIFGTDRFADLFSSVIKHYYPGQKACYIAGVRCEESPTRFMGLTQHATYQDITRGSKQGDDKYTFYPLYDRSYRDIWKYIFDNKVKYNKIYDIQYQYGTPIMNMRVSSLNHETAIRHLFYIQEVDTDLYNRLCKRMSGVSTASQLGFDDFYVKDLPFMFKNWIEYRDYLLDVLVTSDETREKFKKTFDRQDEVVKGDLENEIKVAKVHVQSIVTNDHEGTKTHNLDTSFLSKYKKDKRLLLEKIEAQKLKESEDEI